jgi:hypothetical protein
MRSLDVRSAGERIVPSVGRVVPVALGVPGVPDVPVVPVVPDGPVVPTPGVVASAGRCVVEFMLPGIVLAGAVVLGVWPWVWPVL